jgi:hypothetical protein
MSSLSKNTRYDGIHTLELPGRPVVFALTLFPSPSPSSLSPSQPRATAPPPPFNLPSDEILAYREDAILHARSALPRSGSRRRSLSWARREYVALSILAPEGLC